MKNPILATALMLSLCLAACQDDRAPAARTPDAQPSPSAQAEGAVPAGDPLPDALPQGVAIDFPYHFIKREDIPASNGKEARLRYTLEYLEGDAASVTASLAGSMMEAGFQSGRWQARGDGRIHFAANKNGYGQMQANIIPLGKSSKPRNAAAKGSVTLGWPAQDAPVAEAIDAQASAPAAEQ